MIAAGEARRLSRPKQPLTDVLLLEPERLRVGSPTGLTANDAALNAFGAARLAERKPFGSRIGNNIDRAMSKVEQWPDVHDTKNVVICAGRLYPPRDNMVGAFCPWPGGRGGPVELARA